MSFTGKPAATTGRTITNDGFWPSLTVGELLDNYRVPAEYADNTIGTGLKLAIANVNPVLEEAKQATITAGFSTLALYTAAHPEVVDGEDVLHFFYSHAVYCHAKAFLLQQFNSLNRKPDAENAAKEAPDTEQYWMNQSQTAINNLRAALVPDQSGWVDPAYCSVALI